MQDNTQVKQAVNTQEGTHKFDQGSVLSVLIKVAVPIVILMLFNSAYAFVDSLMSSTYVDYGTITVNGEEVLLNGGTSIGLIFPLMGVLIAFEVMVAVGAGLAYTQSMAQKNEVEARQRHNEAMSMIIYIGLMVWLFIIVFGYPYLMTVSGNWGPWADQLHGQHWQNLNAKMMKDGYSYMVILGLAFMPMQLQQSYVRVLRAEGKGDIAAIIPILTLPVNIFFDWLFMSQLETGIWGAGVATLIASTLGLVMMWIYVWYQGKGDNLVIKFALPRFRIHNEVVIIILTFAMGSLLRRLFDNLTVITISSYIGNMNVASTGIPIQNWTGSWTIMTRSVNMGSMLALGVAQSMSMLISYYSNSEQNEKVGLTIKFGAISMIVCTLTAFAFLFGMQEVLFHAYNPETAFGFEWFNPISIAFIIALIYSIPLSLQPMAVMFYAGMKQPKLTLIHSATYNFIVIMFATLGLVIDLQTGNPLWIFGMLLAGSIVGLSVVTYLFRYRYKQLMYNY